MVKRSIFLTTLLFTLVLSFILASPEPEIDYFNSTRGDALMSLDAIPVEDYAKLKIKHLESRKAYSVILFGNSRSLPVHYSDLSLSRDDFFNASLAGESIRTSVLFLEHLQRIGKLPDLALISFDHSEINFYGNPAWPLLSERFSQLFQDIAYGVTSPDAISKADLARMLLRHGLNESKLFTRSFDASRVHRGVLALLAKAQGQEPNLAPLSHSSTGTRNDGSRILPAPIPFTGQSMVAPDRVVLPGYLDYDLARLAKIQQAGVHVILYETLLYPPIHQSKMQTPTVIANETRLQLQNSCIAYSLECHSAPPLVAASSDPWSDEGHPPASILGPYLTSMISSYREGSSK